MSTDETLANPFAVDGNRHLDKHIYFDHRNGGRVRRDIRQGRLLQLSSGTAVGGIQAEAIKVVGCHMAGR